MYVTRNHYEKAAEYEADAYTIAGSHAGVAWYVLGWETEPDEETEWTGMEPRTDRLVVCMVGDDCHYAVETDEVVELAREDYCGECGQVGCTHDGLPREGV
jgi:hypothetical protein